jgi:hypothetical protein
MKLSLRIPHRPAADPPLDETVIASSTSSGGRPAPDETVIARSVSDAAIPRQVPAIAEIASSLRFSQ